MDKQTSTTVITVWKLANLIGIALAIWAYSSYHHFDPRIALFSQPHWWLLILMWAANPRALAVYYILCAKPEVGPWWAIAFVGCLIVPGAWGLYYLPGLSAAQNLRIGLSVAGFVLRDVVEKDLVEKPLVRRLGG